MAHYAGTLPGWLTLLTLAAMGYVYLRGGSGTAVSGLQDTNRELVRQINEFKTENEELRRRVSVLESKTDFTLAIAPVISEVRAHEIAAAKRGELVVGILGQIADKLGPEATA